MNLLKGFSLAAIFWAASHATPAAAQTRQLTKQEFCRDYENLRKSGADNLKLLEFQAGHTVFGPGKDLKIDITLPNGTVVKDVDVDFDKMYRACNNGTLQAFPVAGFYIYMNNKLGSAGYKTSGSDFLHDQFKPEDWDGNKDEGRKNYCHLANDPKVCVGTSSKGVPFSRIKEAGHQIAPDQINQATKKLVTEILPALNRQ